MKKTTLFTLVAVCGAFAVALPDWKKPLNAAYPNPQFVITTKDSSDPVGFKKSNSTESLSVAGCKSLKTVTKSDITLYDNNSYALYRYDKNGTQTNILTGSWYKLDGKSSNTVYLSLNSASLSSLYSELNVAALAQCKTNPKYASMTHVTVLEPATLVKKNTMVVKIKNNAVSGSLQIKGKQTNDAKGTDVTGSFGFKTALKGGTWSVAN